MNLHLFRHFAGKLYLERHPGDYESVRRLLGHKKLDTTMTFYSVFDNKFAHGRYHDIIRNVRTKRGNANDHR